MRERILVRVRRGALLAGVALCGCNLSLGMQDELPAGLGQAAADYDRAQVKGDKVLLNRLLADDYRLVNGAAQVESKEQFVAESVDPAAMLEPFTVEHAIQTVWADGAVLAGEVHLKGQDHGKPFEAHFRFADVWRKRGGAWQVVFTEVTRFPGSKPGG